MLHALRKYAYEVERKFHNFDAMRCGFFCGLIPLFFSILLSAQPFETKILRGVVNDHAKQWETVEIGIRIPAQERLYRQFLDDSSKGINPYASQNLHMQFACNGKVYNVRAFYMEQGVPLPLTNSVGTTPAEWPWRVRFAVPDTGTWQCVLLTGIPVEMAVPHNAGISFHCVKSSRHGHLRVADDNQHLRFSNGKPFFALGQNIAWCDPVLTGHPGPYPVYSGGYYDVFHYIHNLADNGGNYVRIVMAPWSTGFEWKRAGVYEQDHAWAMDSIVRICEERGVFLHVCVEMHSGYTVNYDAAYNWNMHPYKKHLGLVHPTEVLTNDSAISLYKQKMRYLLARWGTSPSVAVIELLSEMNGWDGYYEHEDDFVSWHDKICSYVRLELKDTNNILTTCFGPPPYGTLYDLPWMQLTSSHRYANNFKAPAVRYKVVHRKSLRREGQGLRTRWNKPFLFGEMGLINGPGNNCDPDDWEHCSDLSFHNQLWSTAFMGGYGAGLNWWQWINDDYRKANFPGIRWFVDSIANGMQDFHIANEWRGNGLESYYCVSDPSRSKAVGWVHNTSYWWGNNTDSCLDRSGKKMPLPPDDDKARTFENRQGHSFTIEGLQPRQLYTVIFYDTRIPGCKISETVEKSTIFGKVEVKMPAINDCAFYVYPYFP